MPLHPKQVLDTGKPVLVIRAFLYNGKAYQIGEVFEWDETHPIPANSIVKLFDSRKISHPKEVVKAALKEIKLGKKEKYQMIHRGKGRWIIFDLNGKSSSPGYLTKDEAKDKLKELNKKAKDLNEGE